jgi:ABC-type sugar transport system ATPase subunit
MGEILRVDGISKSFPGVQALNKINASFNEGEIYALVGENGAGKSTLVSILMGALKPDEGKLYIKDNEVSIKGVYKAKGFGIGAVFQEPSLINYMSVAENIFLGEQGKFKNNGILSYSRIKKAAEKILDDLKIDIDVSQLAVLLEPAQRKLIELAKMIRHDPDLIILDEITAALDYDNVVRLFEIIRDKRDKGKSIIFISHKLKEVFEIAGKAVVLKEGKVVDTLALKETNEEDLISLMMGRKLSEVFPERKSLAQKEKKVTFAIKNLSVKDKLVNIDLEINKGEIVALAGLRGHGQSELLKAVFGIIPKSNGKIFINDKIINVGNPVEAKKEKIAFLSNKREDELCFTHSIRRNIALSSLGKRQVVGFIKQSQEKKEVNDMFAQMNIKAPSAGVEVGNLSGGNKQKVVFSKWMLTEPELLLCDEPAEGLDVGAKSEVYHVLRRLADGGKSILLVLSDMVEILNLPDKVIVIREGKIVKEFDNIVSENREVLEKKILKASVGVI